MSEQKEHELRKCCKKYPRYHQFEGQYWVECECGNMSAKNITGYWDACLSWNKMRDRQLKVENLYNGKQHWYKKTQAPS